MRLLKSFSLFLLIAKNLCIGFTDDSKFFIPWVDNTFLCRCNHVTVFLDNNVTIRNSFFAVAVPCQFVRVKRCSVFQDNISMIIKSYYTCIFISIYFFKKFIYVISYLVFYQIITLKSIIYRKN